MAARSVLSPDRRSLGGGASDSGSLPRFGFFDMSVRSLPVEGGVGDEAIAGDGLASRRAARSASLVSISEPSD